VTLTAGDAVSSTLAVADTGSEVRPFEKYTEEEDSSLRRLERFSWFIEVPQTEASWYVWDMLPPAFILTDIEAPLGVTCSPILAFGVLCDGNSDLGPVTIELEVMASPFCHEYTNRAKLFSGLQEPQIAASTVVVECGAEGSTGSTGPTGPIGPASSNSDDDIPWWQRLWDALMR
jgi:hypothetical protein